MRRMILSTLILLPVLAHAEIGKPAETSAAIPSGKAAVRESAHAQFSGAFLETAMREGGTLGYTMRGSAPLQSSAPKVTRAVEVDLSPQELSEQPAVSSVVVHAIVDENGMPRNVAVTHSAGAVLDRKAIAAVSQYRFKPATLDSQPTWAEVSIAIKIQK